MNIRVFLAIALGAVIGSSLIYSFAWTGIWYLVGAVVGGLIAWLVFVWPDLIHQTALWRQDFSGWQPDKERWALRRQLVTSTFLLALTAGAGVAVFWTVGHILINRLLFGAWDILDPFQYPNMYLLLFGITTTWVVVCDRTDVNTSNRGVRFFLKKRQSLIRHFHPLWVFDLLLACLIAVWEARMEICRSCIRLFVAVHSKDALDCFIYAAVGVLLGVSFGSTAWVIPTSAIIGVGVALIFRVGAGLIPEKWYVSV